MQITCAALQSKKKRGKCQIQWREIKYMWRRNYLAGGALGLCRAEMAEAAAKVIQPVSPLPAKVGTSAATKQMVAEIRERAGD